ncbi:MAG: hypothetical protein QOJ99_3932 [Bryobacterales bacterium]|jgi:hypothetical protein|nr:hypothetical protein [Bryobacterales bacterium]
MSSAVDYFLPTRRGRVSALVSLRDDAQGLQYFWRGLVYGYHPVAELAVIGDLFRVFMATEAPGRVSMAEVVGVGSPGNVQVREDIAVVNGQEGPACRGDLRRLS